MSDMIKGFFSSICATLFMKLWNFDKKDQISEKKTGSIETSDNSRVSIDQTAPENNAVKKSVGKIKTGTGSPVTIKQ